MRREDPEEERDELTSPSTSFNLDVNAPRALRRTGIATTRDASAPLLPEAAPETGSDSEDTVKGVLPVAEALA